MIKESYYYYYYYTKCSLVTKLGRIVLGWFLTRAFQCEVSK